MFTNLLLVAGMLLVVQDAVPTEGKFPGGLPHSIYKTPDAETVKQNLLLFSSSEHETKEFLQAAEFLREYCPRGIGSAVTPKDLRQGIAAKTKDIPPLVRRVRDALVKRGLDYQDWHARADAVSSMDWLLPDRRLDQIPLIRDALNDPNEYVRKAAYDAAGDLVSETKIRDKPYEKHLDEVADLLIWKGLTEPSIMDYGAGLDLIDGNDRRIRSLRRVIDSGLIRNPDSLKYAKSLLEGWDPIYGAKMEGERRGRLLGGPDPFGAEQRVVDPCAPSTPQKP